MADNYAGSSHEEMDNYYRRMTNFARDHDHTVRLPDGRCRACEYGKTPHPEGLNG